jgi:GDP-4-dehydro-6-deoxy-D-mannose reductase
VPQLSEGVILARILVTGVSGFVGKHLVHELKKRGHEVRGVGLQPEPHPDIAELIDDYASCDLTDPEAVKKLPLGDIGSVINLAGLAQVGASFSDPEKYKQINVLVLSVLAERILKEKLPIRVLAISTGAVYDSRQPLPLTEDSKLITNGSPYALSKVLMEKRAAELRAEGLDCIVARPFNHIGPGQEPGFLVPDLYEKISRGTRSDGPIVVGNLKTKRDYTDVRDVVRAYADLIELGKPAHNTYNVCCGRSVSGSRIAELLLAAVGVGTRLELTPDAALIRPDDPTELYGSYDRLADDTGWSPQIDIEQTIKDFVVAQKK